MSKAQAAASSLRGSTSHTVPAEGLKPLAPFAAKLKVLASVAVPSPAQGSALVFALAGSVLDYEGDCIVNAANSGGITGFGIDELVNRAGGIEMKDARRELNGIPTGCAKSTPGFGMKRVKFVVHAVGPVFRDNAMSADPVDVKYHQLRCAYHAAMVEAARLGCRDIAFCLLSAGVFRGREPLANVIQAGIDGITAYFARCATISSLRQASLVAFAPEEQAALADCMRRLNQDVLQRV